MAQENKTDALIRFEPDVLEWADQEGARQERSRSWIVNKALKHWMSRLNYDRNIRQKKNKRGNS